MRGRNGGTETQTILDARIKPAEPVFVCLDANAPPGPCYHRHVFSKGFASASGTALLREFCDHFDLCLPSTSGKHSGEVAAWTAPDGLSSHVIDYALVPTALFDAVTQSDRFDLGNTCVDHTHR